MVSQNGYRLIVIARERVFAVPEVRGASFARQEKFDGSAIVCMKRHACFLVERGRTIDAPHELSAATRPPPVRARCFEECYSLPMQ